MIHACRQIILIVLALAALPAGGVQPLRDQWKTACRALAAGDAAAALAAFGEFDRWYGQEAAVSEPGFHEARIRLWALAAMQAGDFPTAVELLERWFREHPREQRFRAYLRFQLAGLCRLTGDPEAAALHHRTFLEEHPDLPECLLVRWAIADEAVARRDYPAAVAEFEAILRNPALPGSGHGLATAALALVEYAGGARESVVDRLDSVPPEKAGRALRFWRALLAPGLVGKLLESGNPEAAVRATRWLDDPAALAGRIRALQEHFDHSAAGAGIRQSVWNARWQSQLGQLRQSMGKASPSANGLDALYALRLKALIAAEAARETAVLGQALIRSADHLSRELLATAYRRTIEACLQLEDWKRAEAFATAFLESYPEDPALPDILFLNARNAAARADWAAAVIRVEDLLARYPDHPASSTWEFLQAGWRLQAGEPEAALRQYEGMVPRVPAAWRPFLDFERGRCLEALRRDAAARESWSAVAANPDAPAGIREAASVSLLQLAFRRMDLPAFKRDLKHYRTAFPGGVNSLLVTNLEAALADRLGRFPEAERLYAAVAAGSAPEAAFAREELSGLYRKIKDNSALRRHALKWIERSLGETRPVPSRPFRDLQYLQEVSGEPVLPRGLPGTLLDAVTRSTRPFPAGAFLDVLAGQWPAYAARMAPDAPSFDEWLGNRANAALLAGNPLAASRFRLHAARRMELAGRTDSADTRRIQVLQDVHADDLDPDALLEIASTAHRYDFPGAVPLLETCLARGAPRDRPAALLMLAERHRRSGSSARARPLLAEVVARWPDAAVYPEACLALARLDLEQGSPDKAAGVMERLLQAGGMPPRTIASALLLRARADFRSGNPGRAVLGCERIMALYPDIHDIAEPAVALLRREKTGPGREGNP